MHESSPLNEKRIGQISEAEARQALLDERPSAVRLGLGVTAFIGFSKHLAINPALSALIGLAAAGMQLFLPLRRADQSPLGDDGIGYHLRGFRRDLPLLLSLFLITALPFLFLHELYWSWLLNRPPGSPGLGIPLGDLSPWIQSMGWLAGPLPALDLLELCLIHFLAVALPEELFFRGYLQPRLCAPYQDRKLPLGFVWNRGIVICSALFALAHFLGEYNPARLGPFFPALLFGLLRRRSGSVGGAILLHGLYNVLGAMLFAGLGE